MNGYIADIKALSEASTAFRHVLYTAHHLQLVLMALKPSEDIGMEIHKSNDQFFRIEKGHGEIVINGAIQKVKGGDVIIVPAGAQHNLTNTGKKTLRLYTLYSPPNHVDGLLVQHKGDAQSSTAETGQGL